MSSGNHEAGFTYLAALLLVAAVGASLVAVAEIWSQTRQREKEAELLWIGMQFKQAIGLYYQSSPGAVKRYPEKLEDLLEDRRHLSVKRHLRKVYADPLTGRPEWSLVRATDGGIRGLHSPSTAKPARQVIAAETYQDWIFAYEAPSVSMEHGNTFRSTVNSHFPNGGIPYGPTP